MPPVGVSLWLAAALAAETEPTARMYGAARASLSLPPNLVGVSGAASVDVGAQFGSGHALGLRLLATPGPGDAEGSSAPEVAMGPVIVWAKHMAVAQHFDISPTLGLGVLFGQSAINPYGAPITYALGGIGLRYRGSLRDGTELFLMPEAGVVVFDQAPMVGLSFGIVEPPSAAAP